MRTALSQQMIALVEKNATAERLDQRRALYHQRYSTRSGLRRAGRGDAPVPAPSALAGPGTQCDPDVSWERDEAGIVPEVEGHAPRE